MVIDELKARSELIEVCRLAYSRGYICGTEGNFSLKLNDNLILSTPSGTCKGRIEISDLVLTDNQGKVLGANDKVSASGSCAVRPSTELEMHLTAYKERPDVKAVVHAHPTVSVGFSIAGVPLSKCLLPEVVCTLGVIPIAPYATPSTHEVSESIAELLRQYDALVLDHHGALTVGANIWDAFYKLETVEHHAQTMLVAQMLGGAKPLSVSQVRRLLEIRGVYGLSRPLPEAQLLGEECSCADPRTNK